MEKKNQMQISVAPEVGKGIYSNLAIIAHSHSEFCLDFASLLPGAPQANVQSRIILAPEHAKRLLYALQDNLSKYESTFGTIELPQGSTNMPPMSFGGGEA